MQVSDCHYYLCITITASIIIIKLLVNKNRNQTANKPQEKALKYICGSILRSMTVKFLCRKLPNAVVVQQCRMTARLLQRRQRDFAEVVPESQRPSNYGMSLFKIQIVRTFLSTHDYIILPKHL